jgi:hypothetical protein
VGSTAETEDEDLVAIFIILDKPVVSLLDILGEAFAPTASDEAIYPRIIVAKLL